MQKKVSYKQVYQLYKKADLWNDVKAGANKAFDSVSKQWNKNPYLRAGIGALGLGTVGGLLGGRTGALLGALAGGTGAYFLKGQQAAKPSIYQNMGKLWAGGTGVGLTGLSLYALSRLLGRNKRLSTKAPQLLPSTGQNYLPKLKYTALLPK